MVWGVEAHWVLGGSMAPSAQISSGVAALRHLSNGETIKTCSVGSPEGENAAGVEHIHASLCSGSLQMFLFCVVRALTDGIDHQARVRS